MKIKLPPKVGGSSTDENFEQLVVIGANGSGKTRFGAKIEKDNSKITHRISAQKSLIMPSHVGTKSKRAAENDVWYGYHYENNQQSTENNKFSNRWKNNINTQPLDDFEKLLVLLHTEEYEECLLYKKEGGNIPPITKLDKIQRIWELVLPHRKLSIKAGTIEVEVSSQNQNAERTVYNASEMSDGERVILYLIGEALCAPKNSIVIIDEPEMHIHKSLVNNLFDQIELERIDCTFIYLTHDIDFASSRRKALKIWIKSFEGNDTWDYEVLNSSQDIPEQLYLEVLGSRKPVMFLEGDINSIDFNLYQYVFPEYTIKPIGSCDKVIQTTKAFNDLQGFHHIESVGIIDRDRRSDDECNSLVQKGIWVLDVAEAENLLLIEDVVKFVAMHMGKDSEIVFQKVKSNLISYFSTQLDAQVLLFFKRILEKEFRELTNFSGKEKATVFTEIRDKYQSINLEELYNNTYNDFNTINEDYDSILKKFNLKNALIPKSQICEETGIKNTAAYLDIVLTLLKKNDETSDRIKQAIKSKIRTSTPD